ncbi:MAG TPA: SRPBCC family protein [Acidimicrobiales bacterium]|nr:SRPBCC family protein [Acidimicrobiales bacterium]
MEIDLIEAAGAVRRAVDDRTVDGAPAKAVVAIRTYEADIDDVWDAITNAERIPRWLAPISGDLCLGGTYQLEGNAGGTITTCDAPRHLAVTWEYGGQVSWVDVTLTTVEHGTSLRLEHVAPVDPHWGEYGPGAVGIGWDLSLLGLLDHLATGGGPADPAEVFASPDGIRFMQASSLGWCEADIAGGTPADVARAAEARTIAAYTATE